MCTAIVDVGPVLLLAGVRDEFIGRPWQPPARHWPQYPGLTGGLDLVAGGTWLAVAPEARRVACVLNGRGRMAPEASRRSRGVLPLQAAAEGKLAQAELADFDPFHLVTAEPGRADLASWDGERLTEQELGPGLHVIVNSGLDHDLLRAGDSMDAPGRAHERARLGYFLPRLRSASRPGPAGTGPVAEAWGDWMPLMNGDGLAPSDTRALILRHDLGDGRVFGTTSISLVALAADEVRYDFTGRPGDPAAWQSVPLPGPGPA
ncbi:MAG TPA: NRDE family protein [Streptosporangiaceae bacterium]|jgi:hypothetical protein|nr:NRDE family protein [Streptosporangiaceae bacterium]